MTRKKIYVNQENKNNHGIQGRKNNKIENQTKKD
jgi:hypothetical protein